MTEAMPFLRKPILLSYDPRPCAAGLFLWGWGLSAGPTTGAPRETAGSGFAGERRSGGVSEPRRLRRGEGYGARDDEAPRTDCPREPRYGRHVLRSAKACGAARMDRSEGTKRKSRKAAPFRARDGGKPRVAQPPQRDMAMQYDFQSSTALGQVLIRK